MERISERQTLKSLRDIRVVMPAFFGVCFVLTGFNLWILFFLITNLLWARLLATKLKELHFDGESLYVYENDRYEQISLDEIRQPIKESFYLSGSYRINFVRPGKYGRYILFMPRSNKLLQPHPEFRALLSRVNVDA